MQTANDIAAVHPTMSRPASHDHGDASHGSSATVSLALRRPSGPEAGVYMARAGVGRTDGSPTSDYASNMHMVLREHGTWYMARAYMYSRARRFRRHHSGVRVPRCALCGPSPSLRLGSEMMLDLDVASYLVGLPSVNWMSRVWCPDALLAAGCCQGSGHHVCLAFLVKMPRWLHR